MAGLLDFLTTDDAALGLGLLAAAGPSAQPMSLGQRLAQGVDYARQRQDAKLRSQLLQSQMDENVSQAAYRKAMTELETRKLAARESFWRGAGLGAAPGGVAGAGGGPTAAPAGGPGGLIANMNADQIARAKSEGIGDFTELWKATRQDPVEVAPGVWADKRTMPLGTNQGAIDARTRDRIEQSDINMRGDMVTVKDAQGREWLVPKLSLVGNAPAPARAPLPGPPLGAPGPVSAGLPPAQPGMSGAFMVGSDGKVDVNRAMMAIQSIGDPQEKANALAGLQRQVAAEGSGGAPAPAPAIRLPGPPLGMPAGAIPSGMSRAEADAADARKAAATSLASQTGSILKDSQEQATNAVQAIGTAQRIQQALDSNKVLTGPTASVRMRGLQLASTLGIQGRDDAEILANTRTAIQEMAKLTIAGRKTMSGQGAITDKESALAEKASSGNIDDLTPAEIRQLAGAAERSARFQYQQHQTKLDELGKDPSMASQLGVYKAPPLPESSRPGGGKTVVRTGTMNGRKVVQYSDGSIDYGN